MSRQERRIYAKCIAIMAAYIIAGVYFYTLPVDAETADAPDLREKAVFTDDQSEVDNFTADDAKMDLRAVFDENSAMPCCDRESFERWYAEYERETEKETLDRESESGVPSGSEVASATWSEVDAEVETECIQNPIYMVDGQTLQTDLQEYLYQRLSDYGIGWFMPYAIMIAYQESKFDCYAQNSNGLDKGLFQFRITYYPGQDIFDPFEQIDIFAQQMANRSQYDVYEMISRHNVSDFGEYNGEYVSQVLAHESKLRKVE